MTGGREDALRTFARDVAAHAQAQTGPAGSLQAGTTTVLVHTSHWRFATLPPGGGACLIEPHVACTHCGYCQSYGH